MNAPGSNTGGAALSGGTTVSASQESMVFLHAGQLIASAEPLTVVTILGSCVSACVWDPVLRIGGLNHFMLPGPGPADAANGRYAAGAFDELLLRLFTAGADPRRLQAKLFGGGCILAAPGRAPGTDLGAKNIAAARERLAHEQIPVVAEDVGGSRGRKLIFRTDDGTAHVKLV